MQSKLKKLFNIPNSRLPLQSLPEFEPHICFINRLEIPVRLTTVVEKGFHSSNSMAGWEGLHSLTCLGEDKQLYDIDIRYAWGSEIFKQNLVDHGWSEATLLHKKNKQEPIRNKLIIYLCEDATNLDKNQKTEPVPDSFLVGEYWQSIYHIYVLLPVEHPFDIPDFDVKTRIAGYSTTRGLTRNQTNIVNVPESKIGYDLFLPNNLKQNAEGSLRIKGLGKESPPDQPLVSVITVVFNGEKYIEQTIQSVINQPYDNVEYIIIDGGSKDKTLEIIKTYNNVINYWISEPDEGIYDAMNKGVKVSKANYIYFLGSDDILLTLPLEAIKNADFKNIGCVYSNVIFSNGKLFKGQYNLFMAIRNLLPHQGLFVQKKIIKSLRFNTKYKVYADFDLNQRMYKNQITALKCTSLVAYFRLGGSSSSSNNLKKDLLKQEYAAIVCKNFGFTALILGYLFGKIRNLMIMSNIDIYPDYKTLKQFFINRNELNDGI